MSALFKPSSLLAIGDTAPDFELKNQDGETISLHKTLQHGWVVLFFYPKDHSPVCTTQVCAFRDAYADFRETGAELLGISADSAESHRAFLQKQRLPFPLLCDPGAALAKRYGVSKAFGLIPGRATFVIDPQRTVRLTYSDILNGKAHTQKALQLLRQQHPNL